MPGHILVIDQGTTGSRAIIFDDNGDRVAMEYKEFTQHYPRPGWVEHDPKEIWTITLEVAQRALSKANMTGKDIASIGITNQRETTTIWDKRTGEPVYNSIVWACRRTTEICSDLIDKGYTEIFNKKTGLVIDPVYSASKIKWILDNVLGVRRRAEKGELLFGTIDTWILWNLTGGRVHATDYSNASRTMLFNVNTIEWDKELLQILGVPENILPEAKPSVGLFGYTDKSLFGYEIPITGIAGDQQAALFGQACFEEGTAKNTYGTSCVPLMFTGDKPVFTDKGLLTLAWGINNKVKYSMGASIFTAGSAIQWLRDSLNMIKASSETESIAESVKDNAGVYFVPAFTGLGAPHWDMYARGMIIGLTSNATKAHIIRATLESLAYQTRDLLDEMENKSGIKLKFLKVDGGAANNNFLMQFQADILNCTVIRPKDVETTSLGAAYLAGIGSGIWKNEDEIKSLWKVDREFYPQMDNSMRDELYSNWVKAVQFSKGWLKK
ncbi:glycerol kinase GlpK [Fonticella tunisiensis]|uniref:Glycerol kinase n=1 Tax=Fonticella tunisiensis TaxID=1096341 RepID=A0A4R7KQ47_9CLOT|nr:glycerol kinase GlpK [Fonticella tunisiensis]TDT61280.1 glycerol kinase [Fonticella tunisiensis]